MGQHARYHVVLPSRKLSHLVVVHAQLGFGLLKTLFDCPTQAAEPYECFQPRAR